MNVWMYTIPKPWYGSDVFPRTDHDLPDSPFQPYTPLSLQTTVAETTGVAMASTETLRCWNKDGKLLQHNIMFPAQNDQWLIMSRLLLHLH
jgi:hypothetical protein